MEDNKLKAAKEIIKSLVKNGFRSLFAGGYVRDSVMGLLEKGDIDIATSATPKDVCRIFPHVVLVGEQFGVVRVNHKGMQFEVATFRKDLNYKDGRHPENVEFSCEKEDALRRDFTINGMFYDPLKNIYIDYVGGKSDIKNKIIRAIGDPYKRFSEDYLRMMRAIRFCAKFDFTIEENTWEAIKKNALEIKKISAERIFMELEKMLVAKNRGRAVKLLQKSGLLKYIIPELEDTIGIDQPKEFHPEGDVFTHTVRALDMLENPTRTSAFAVLLHDIGKTKTMSISDRIRFSNHDKVGASIAEKVLKRLKAPSQLINDVCSIIENHMNFMNVKKMRISTLKKFLSRQTLKEELEVHRADCLASHGDISNYLFLKEKEKELSLEKIKPKPLVTGKDLIALGFVPGPLFKKILDDVYELQLEDRLNTKNEALNWVKKNY
jgi:poly(A) polymerase